MVDESLATTLAESFAMAAIGELPWETALNSLAGATGAHSAQLIGFGANFFNWQTNVDPLEHHEFDQIGGYDGGINSRIRIGVRAPELTVLDETAFETEADMARAPDYGDYLRRRDMHHICLTNLDKRADAHIGLSVMRGVRAGGIPAAERRLFERTAPHVRAAIRTYVALERRSLIFAVDSLEVLDVAAVLIDRSGRVCGVSRRAEDLIRAGDLCLRDGRLTLGAGQPETSRFARAVGQALSVHTVGDPSPRPISIRGADGLAYLLEILPLPSRARLPMEAGALVVARTPRQLESAATRAAAQLHGLSSTEAAVAGLLAGGRSPREIAERQGVTVGTVRNQLHSLFQKSGAEGQLGFVADLLSRL